MSSFVKTNVATVVELAKAKILQIEAQKQKDDLVEDVDLRFIRDSWRKEAHERAKKFLKLERTFYDNHKIYLSVDDHEFLFVSR